MGAPQFPRSPLNSSKRFQELIHVHQLVDRVDLGKGDFAGLVHDEGGTLADAGDGRAFAHDVELAGNGGVRIEVGAHGETDRSDFFFAPCCVAGNRIYADVQDLGIEGRELAGAGVKLGHL